MKNGISDASRKKVAKTLAELLATTYAIYIKTQHAHWNVEGLEFYSHHILLEKQYDELAEAIDEIAERIRSLGFPAEGSFATFARNSWIKDGATKHSFIKDLLECHEALQRTARPHIVKFQELGDDTSADLLIRRLTVHEKAAWMLRSSLK